MILGLNVIGTRMDIGSVDDALAQLFDIVIVDDFRVRQNLCHVLRDSNLVNAQIRIGRNNGTTAKVDTLAAQIATESALFAL